MEPGRDFWWHDLMAERHADCPAEPLDSETPLFILYTSGSTGKPKGIMHTTAGYNLFAKKTFEWVFDHPRRGRLLVYGRHAAGSPATATSSMARCRPARPCCMYEGAPNWPDEGRFWEMIEKYRVNIFYTAPTAIRTFIKWGDHWVDKHDLSSLRLLGTVGEGHQSRGLDVVSPQDRRRALPDRRHLVADRDRRDHDEPAARRDRRPSPAVAPSRCPASCRRSSTTTGKPVPAGQRRLAGDHQALAGHAARHLGRRRALQEQYWSKVPHNYLCRRQRPPRRGRLLLDHGPHRRRAERRRPSPEHDRDRKRAGEPPGGGRGGRGRPAARASRARPSPCSSRSSGGEPSEELREGAEGPRPQGDRRAGPARRHPLHRRRCRRPAAARSCAACSRDIAAGKETVGDTTTLEDYSVLAKLRSDEE